MEREPRPQPARSDPVPSGSPRASNGRNCGTCSLCCTVLRVDALEKLGGCDCIHQRGDGGCGIYAERPSICRAYRCLWLKGSLDLEDRPDHLGAVLDLVARGPSVRLEIRQATAGAFDASLRLQEIAEQHRGQMPVRITHVENAMDPEQEIRVLLPNGEEQRIEGDRVTILRPGRPPEQRRLPWLERWVEELRRRFLARRLRHYRGGRSQSR